MTAKQQMAKGVSLDIHQIMSTIRVLQCSCSQLIACKYELPLAELSTLLTPSTAHSLLMNNIHSGEQLLLCRDKVMFQS